MPMPATSKTAPAMTASLIHGISFRRVAINSCSRRLPPTFPVWRHIFVYICRAAGANLTADLLPFHKCLVPANMQERPNQDTGARHSCGQILRSDTHARQERGVYAAECPTEAHPGIHPRSNRLPHSAGFA